MNQREEDIILHASGLYRSRESYRNYYCTKLDDVELCRLVSDGYFSGPHEKTFLPKSEGFFFLTDRGMLKAHQIREERCV